MLQSWDDELELMSQVSALFCNVEANDQLCLTTPKYKIPGTNRIELCQWTQNVQPNENLINRAMQSWYDHYKGLKNLEDVNNVGSTGADISNFGNWMQMVRSNADRIGCSMIEYTKQDEYYCKQIVCNNNAAVLQGLPVFTFGAPASRCKMGKNPNYPGLCDRSEDFAEHKFGKHYFDNTAAESPLVKLWLEHGKKFNL